MVVIYKILQWADKFCEGTIYQCDENKFFSSKILPRGFRLYAERERGEKKRGEVGKYHFNLTFLRMRVNNTYPMESYFFPSQNHIGLYTPHRVLHSQRERQRESLPRTANHLSINPSRPAKKGGSRKELVLLSPPDRSLRNVAFTRLSTSLIPTPERALSRQDP